MVSRAARSDQLHCRGPIIDVVERLGEDFRMFAPDMLVNPKVSPAAAVS